MNNVFKTFVIYIKQIVILCNPKQIGKCKQHISVIIIVVVLVW